MGLSFCGAVGNVGDIASLRPLGTRGSDTTVSDCKQSTTKWPLLLVNVQLLLLLMRAMLKVYLRWRPCEGKQDADELTSQRI